VGVDIEFFTNRVATTSGLARSAVLFRNHSLDAVTFLGFSTYLVLDEFGKAY